MVDVGPKPTYEEKMRVLPWACALGAQKNPLIEMVLWTTHNMFWVRNI